jgi:hypothetical protein
VDIIIVRSWDQDKFESYGGWDQFFQRKMGWVRGKKTVFIFDDAQVSYGDSELWLEFFKNHKVFNVPYVIGFARYGGPTSSIHGQDSFFTQHTPVVINDSHRVTLRPIDHLDGLDPVGLLFTRTEFDDLIHKQYSSDQHHYFHPSFFDGVYNLTGGHIGAIQDFMGIITGHNVRFFYDVGTHQLTSYLSLIVDSRLLANLTRGIHFWKKSIRMNS